MREHPSAESVSDDMHPRPGKSLGQLAADLLTLLELQTELAQIDCGEAMSKARMPSFLVCVGIATAIGSCPLALLGLAWWLADMTALSVAGASLIVAVLGLVIAGGLFYIAWKQFCSSAASFKRSSEEFRSNLNWLKHVFVNRSG